MRKHSECVLLALTTVLVFTSSTVQAVPTLPNFAAATFVPGAPIDNPFFSLDDFQTRIYEGDREEGGQTIVERFELTNLGPGPTILGVPTTTRRDRAYIDGGLVEDTFDFYAQDTAGNVWYLGEDVTNYLYDPMGNFLGTNNSSTWRAGVNGAQPGFVMPVDLTVGFNYYQEHAPADNALDQATTNAVGQMVSFDFGNFTNVLRILETSELDPDAREFKHYASGHGLILVDQGLNTDLMEPELTFELIAIVPEPSTLALLALGLAGLLMISRWN